MKELQESKSAASSPRFEEEVQRRDFLGITALWSFIGTGVVMAAGALRLPMPSVFPETGSRFKIGPPTRFALGSTTRIEGRNVLIRRDERGIRALSLICTHLGCISQETAEGGFTCPCHGSRFDAEGAVTQGPAPTPLRYFEISRAPNGELIVDAKKVVASEQRLTV